MIIILEGVSKSGKSTLIREYNKDKNRHSFIDRFTPSNYVYGELKDREPNYDIEELLNIDNKVKDISHIIHLIVSKQILNKRNSPDREFGYDKIEELYNEYYNISPLKVTKINCSGKSPSEIVTKMLNVVE